MDIKQLIEQKVDQTVEHLISDFEDKYIAYIIGNEVIKVKVKFDAKISSVEFDTDSKEPIINNLVEELNADYFHIDPSVLSWYFYGTKSNPMLQIDDRYFLCMIGMPHQVTRLEYNSPLKPTVKFVGVNELSDGDWVLYNRHFLVDKPCVEDFALVYRDELYRWNYSQVEHEAISENNYFKLIF